MKINNISIVSHTAPDFEINVAKPITILRGKHSALALDLMREVLGDHNSVCDPDNIEKCKGMRLSQSSAVHLSFVV